VKPQGVREESLGILEFAARTKLRRDRDFEEFEGKMRVEVTSQKSSSEGDAELFGQEYENLNGWLKFSEGELSIFVCGPLDPVDQWRS
jgi:hypothetical protein